MRATSQLHGWLVRVAGHTIAMNKGCSTMIAMKIQKRDEKSNDMANVLPVCAENFVRLIW
jgi:hypothetical protein